MSDLGIVLDRMFRTLQQRHEERPAGSYTTQLLDGGAERIGAKVMEEARELVEAASEEGTAGRDHTVYEAGDLLYHMAVLLVWRGIGPGDLAGELARREGMSGLEEKRRRTES